MGCTEHVPEARGQAVRGVGIDREIHGTGLLVEGRHAIPGLPAIVRPEHAALRIRRVRIPETGHIHDVGILRIAAVTSVALTYVVVRELPFQYTTDEMMKVVPVTVNANAHAPPTDVGLSSVPAGAKPACVSSMLPSPTCTVAVRGWLLVFAPTIILVRPGPLALVGGPALTGGGHSTTAMLASPRPRDMLRNLEERKPLRRFACAALFHGLGQEGADVADVCNWRLPAIHG